MDIPLCSAVAPRRTHSDPGLSRQHIYVMLGCTCAVITDLALPVDPGSVTPATSVTVDAVIADMSPSAVEVFDAEKLVVARVRGKPGCILCRSVNPSFDMT